MTRAAEALLAMHRGQSPASARRTPGVPISGE